MPLRPLDRTASPVLTELLNELNDLWTDEERQALEQFVPMLPGSWQFEPSPRTHRA